MTVPTTTKTRHSLARRGFIPTLMLLTGIVLQGCGGNSPVGPATAKAASPSSSSASPSNVAPTAPVSHGAVVSTESTPRVSSTVSSEYSSLAKLMQEGLHEPFTELSFIIWHDKPLTPEKYEALRIAALKVRDIATQIPAFRRSRWTGEEIAFYENHAMRLADLAGYLAEAAKRQQQDHVVHHLMDLESTCQKCHATFAPDLKF
jgi:hypothetical protein